MKVYVIVEMDHDDAEANAFVAYTTKEQADEHLAMRTQELLAQHGPSEYDETWPRDYDLHVAEVTVIS